MEKIIHKGIHIIGIRKFVSKILPDMVSFLKSNKTDAILIPGRSPLFIKIFMEYIQKMDTQYLINKAVNSSAAKNIKSSIEYFKKMKMVSLAFSGKAGLHGHGYNSKHTPAGAEKFRKYLGDKIGPYKNITVFDYVGQGGAL